ncbi:transmembrane amino acid transporter protein-domain-containing protein [Xylogone sp. PMI_703]|nr:transmembrane amino acid transporter protein-domain-containing protein [Xylogone sp. PMI_703]
MPSYSAIAGSSDGAAARRRRSHRSLKDLNFAGQASWISSNVNLVNTIIGAGTLAMPAAMSHMGITLGVIVILWAGLTSAFGLYLQTQCARYLDRGSSSFFALSQLTYPNAAVIFDAAIAIKCFGVGVSYLIIIGDLMPGVVQGFNPNAGSVEFLVDRHFWVTVFMLVVIPLSFLRRLDSLKYTSVVALVSIGYLVILVVYHFAKGDTLAERGDVLVFQWAGLIPTLKSFPVVVFAYTCHQNMFSILNEIKDNSHTSTTSVIGASIGSAASVYILVAITGYLSFGSNVAGNIVGMYAPSVASTIGKAAIVILVMFSYPLQVHPCRASVDAVLKWRPNALKLSDSPNGSPARTRPLLSSSPARPRKNDSIDELRFAIITTVIIVLSYIVAMTVSSLDKVLAYVGSTGSTSISFILPGLFYYKISAPDSVHHQRLMKEDDEAESEDEDEGVVGLSLTKPGTWRKALLRKLSLALSIYGMFVMVVCLLINLIFSGAAH